MKKKFELEYTMNSLPGLLYSRLSTPGGLSEWFADDVNLRGNVFTFYWDESEQKARVVQKKENRYIRFRWIDNPTDETYFEFRIKVDELTGDVALMVIDFTEDNEKKDTVGLWNTQIAKLRHVMGL
jgi:hypothetical protein